MNEYIFARFESTSRQIKLRRGLGCFVACEAHSSRAKISFFAIADDFIEHSRPFKIWRKVAGKHEVCSARVEEHFKTAKTNPNLRSKPFMKFEWMVHTFQTAERITETPSNMWRGSLRIYCGFPLSREDHRG